MTHPIETFGSDRLIGDRLRPQHFNELCRLYQDPKVMATLSADGNIVPEEEVQKRLQQFLEHWNRYGFGVWMFRDKVNKQFVGRGGLKHSHVGGNDEVELLYTVISEHWGKGLATEMAEVILTVAFEQLGLADVVCFTLTTNKASQRVMEKVGFQYERDILYVGLPHVFYRLTASEWQSDRVAGQHN